jgi:hypothetical protein
MTSVGLERARKAQNGEVGGLAAVLRRSKTNEFTVFIG